MKIDVKAFALTCGSIAGAFLFLLTWWLIDFEGITNDPLFIGRVYRGYNLSPLGSLIGFCWAFVDGLIGGAIFAWLYNWLSNRSTKVDA